MKAWFNNNARVSANSRKVLNLNQATKRTRRPSLAQTFSHIYWNKPLPDGTILWDEVADAWPAAWRSSKKYDASIPIPRFPVSFSNEYAAQLLVLQPPWLKAEIAAHPSRQVKVDESDDEEDNITADLARAQAFQK